MSKLTLNLETLSVETFATAPDLVEMNAEFISRPRQSCIEQCTTSCVP